MDQSASLATAVITAAPCPKCHELMRSFAEKLHEAQFAHDLFVGLILGEATQIVLPASVHMERLRGNADTLCWLLGHDHNAKFSDHLAAIQKAAAAAGYTFERRESADPYED